MVAGTESIRHESSRPRGQVSRHGSYDGGELRIV